MPQSNYQMNKQNVNAYGSAIQAQRLPPQKYSTPPQPTVLMAAPTRTSTSALTSFNDERGSSSTTIEAKPILRNKMVEITRFVPTSLVVRRDAKSKPTQKSGKNFFIINY